MVSSSPLFLSDGDIVIGGFVPVCVFYDDIVEKLPVKASTRHGLVTHGLGLRFIHGDDIG